MPPIPHKKEKRQIFTAPTRQRSSVRFYGVKNNCLTARGAPVINGSECCPHRNNWATSKWHSGTLGERKYCNSTSQRICSQRHGRNFTRTKLGSSNGNTLHTTVPGECFLSPHPQAAQTDGGHEKHRICAFCLSSSLCWRYKQQSTLYNPGMKSYPVQIEKVSS